MKYPSLTPYHYCGNNPVMRADPDGKIVLYAKGVSEELKKQFQATVSYMNEKGTGGLLKAINDRPEIIYIAEGSGKSYFDSKTKTIYWDPEMGVITEEGVIISPATVLNHEADHTLEELVNPEQKSINKKTVDEEYTNAEEKRVITGSEQTTARKHGEIEKGEVTRSSHRGQPYETVSPTTTQGKYECIVKPNNAEIER